MAALQRILDRLKATRGYRAWTRYGEANGDLLAAGVGYFAFFSIFPALALAFAIFGFVLQGRPDLVETIAESLNSTLPGMVKTASTPRRHHQRPGAGEPDPHRDRHHLVRDAAARRPRLGRGPAHRHPRGLRARGVHRQHGAHQGP